MEIKSLNIRNIYLFLLLFSIFFSETVIFDTSLPTFFLISALILINIGILKFTKLQLSAILLFFLYIVIIFCIEKYYNPIDVNANDKASHASSLLSNFKFYFGFIAFIFFFQIIKFDKNFVQILKYILLLSCLYIYFDALMVNTFGDIKLHQEVHTSYFLNFYIRPAGFAGNSSISAISILFTYLILRKIYTIKFTFYETAFIFLSILLLFSTTGFLTFLIIIFVINFNPKKINFYLNLIIYFFLLILIFLLTKIVNPEALQKISLDYILYVLREKIFFIDYVVLSKNLIVDNSLDYFFAYKFNQFLTPIYDCFNFFLGCQINQGYPMTSGDAGLIGFYMATGISGVLIFLIVSLSFINFSKINIFYVVLVLLISLHYGFIFSNIGQFIYALLLSKNLNFNKNNKYN